MNEDPVFPRELLCGYVLAGGASSRMGQDKAFLKVGEHTWVEHTVHRLQQVCADVVILGGDANNGTRMNALRCVARVVPDVELRCGPVAGIAAALSDTERPWVLVTAVDQPFLPVWLLRQWSASAMQSAVSASCMKLGDTLQPVPALLKKELGLEISSLVARGEKKIVSVLASALASSGLPPLHQFPLPLTDESSHWFSNLNCPEDAFCLA